MELTHTITGTGNKDFSVTGAASVIMQVLSTSSLAFSVQATFDGTNWITIPVFTKGGTELAPGTSIVPSAGDVYTVACDKFDVIRLVVSAGTGSVYMQRSTVPGAGMGALLTQIASPSLLQYDGGAEVDPTATDGALLIAAPGAGKRIIIIEGSVIAAAASTTERVVTLYEGAGGTDVVQSGLPCKDGRPIPVHAAQLAENKGLYIKASGAITLYPAITYVIEDV